MKRKGVDKIFFAGTSLTEMADYVHKHYGKPHEKARAEIKPDLELARKLTEIEDAYAGEKTPNANTEQPNSEHRTSKVERHWFYRPGWRGQNDVDR